LETSAVYCMPQTQHHDHQKQRRTRERGVPLLGPFPPTAPCVTDNGSLQVGGSHGVCMQLCRRTGEPRCRAEEAPFLPLVRGPNHCRCGLSRQFLFANNVLHIHDPLPVTSQRRVTILFIRSFPSAPRLLPSQSINTTHSDFTRLSKHT
jgi:hypothetical protein